MKDDPRDRGNEEDSGDASPENPDEASADVAPETASKEAGERVFLCDLCGSPMLELHCRLICPRCGYERDCSDP